MEEKTNPSQHTCSGWRLMGVLGKKKKKEKKKREYLTLSNAATSTTSIRPGAVEQNLLCVRGWREGGEGGMEGGVVAGGR